MILCPYCSSNLNRRNGRNALTGIQRYRCKACGRRFQENSAGRAKPNSQPLQVILCVKCGHETTNAKFCSKSCASTYNNMMFPKRERKIRICKHCGTEIDHGRTVCDACNPSIVDWNERTLKSLRDSAMYQANAKVRDIARYNYHKANLPRACANCGYNRHVEICHIQPINTFPDTTPVAVINDLANLVALCPNCHWELDHGILSL